VKDQYLKYGIATDMEAKSCWKRIVTSVVQHGTEKDNQDINHTTGRYWMFLVLAKYL